jgi:hypothetical protein
MIFRAQQGTHLYLRFVQLRFRVADGAVQLFRNLMMLIAFDFMQTEDLSASGGQFLDRSPQGDSIDDATESRIGLANIPRQR